MEVNWIIWSNGPFRFAVCHHIVRIVFESAAVQCFSEKIPFCTAVVLHCKFSFADACRTLQTWWLYVRLDNLGWMKCHFLYLRYGKVLSHHKACFRNTKLCQKSSKSFVSEVTFVSFFDYRVACSWEAERQQTFHWRVICWLQFREFANILFCSR